MPKLTIGGAEIDVPSTLVGRMADRMYKLGNDTRREHYLAQAKQRLDAGPLRRSDAATVLAAGAV